MFYLCYKTTPSSQDIGWRNPSRRVIFYASDAVFHVAGDGKLAGIIQPNLGTCGMSNNKYTRSLNEVNAELKDE